jgi:predicted MFS family arabinose efflux permease
MDAGDASSRSRFQASHHDMPGGLSQGKSLGPVIGRWAARWGRRWLVPLGLAIAAIAAALLIPRVPVFVAGFAVTVLSLGYDMTQPLLAGIVTQLGGKRAGQAMGLNVFTLFLGFGLGSMLFGAAVPLGFRTALALFASVQMLSALVALVVFHAESTQNLARQI